MKIFIAQTLDGYIAGPDGSLDHLKPFEANDYGWDDFIATVDGMIMGRNTFDAIYPDHGWPYPESLPAIIMTHRILPQGVPAHVRVSESIDKAAELMPNAYVDGALVINQCLAKRLVREARIFTLPVLLGTGTRLFPEQEHRPETWQLAATRSFPCGTVESHFRIP